MSKLDDSDCGRRERKRARLHKNDSSLQPLCVGFFDFPEEIRHGILSYLDGKGFSNYATLSKKCHEECKSPTMPIAARTCIVSAAKDDKFDIDHLHDTLKDACASHAFREGSRLKHLKVVNHDKLLVAETPDSIIPFPRADYSTVLPCVTSLDLSVSKACSGEKRILKYDLTRLLANMLPNLLELDTSYTFSFGGISDIIYNCAKLRKLISCGGSAVTVDGKNLVEMQNLKEIYLDGADLKTGFLADRADRLYADYMEDSDSPSVILGSVIDRPERASLVNTTFFGGSKPMTQIGLIKFVRRAKKLRWFRSNLTAENVKILKRERLDVEFVSPVAPLGEKEN